MAFEKGNKLWEFRKNVGRPKKFTDPDELWQKACEYFEWCDKHPWHKQDFVRGGDSAGMKVELQTDRPYAIEELCIFLGVNTQYFSQINLESFPENKRDDFSLVISHIRGIIDSQQFSGAAVGAFSPNLIARRLGLADNIKTSPVIEQKIIVPDKETADELDKLNKKFEEE